MAVTRLEPSALPHTRLGHRTCKTRHFKGFGTERAKLGTFRGFGTEAPSPSPSCLTFKKFGTEREKLGPFRGFGTERARLGAFKKISQKNIVYLKRAPTKI